VPEEQVRFDDDGGIELHLGLAGREPCGWRARTDTGVLRFAGEGEHAARDFFEPVHAHEGHSILTPGGFYIFASRERVLIPPHLAAEMQPVDVGIGELRNNYAGFFDNGFGWLPQGDSGRRGTAAVLEVRAHDVPFLVEDGQVFFRLRYFRASSIPERVYAQGRNGGSYRGQDLTLARAFRPQAD
jgi:dCTP deaminase